MWVEFLLQHYIEARIQYCNRISQPPFASTIEHVISFIVGTHTHYFAYRNGENRHFSDVHVCFLSNVGKHVIDHRLSLSRLRKNSSGRNPLVNVWNKDQVRQIHAGWKDRVWPHSPYDQLWFFSGRTLLKVFCGLQRRVPLSERSCWWLSVTPIISLHIKLQETAPAGSISVFITQSHNFPPGSKLGKHAPSLAATFRDAKWKIIMAVCVSEFLTEFWV